MSDPSLPENKRDLDHVYNYRIRRMKKTLARHILFILSVSNIGYFS